MNTTETTVKVNGLKEATEAIIADVCDTPMSLGVNVRALSEGRMDAAFFVCVTPEHGRVTYEGASLGIWSYSYLLPRRATTRAVQDLCERIAVRAEMLTRGALFIDTGDGVFHWDCYLRFGCRYWEDGFGNDVLALETGIPAGIEAAFQAQAQIPFAFDAFTTMNDREFRELPEDGDGACYMTWWGQEIYRRRPNGKWVALDGKQPILTVAQIESR